MLHKFRRCPLSTAPPPNRHSLRETLAPATIPGRKPGTTHAVTPAPYSQTPAWDSRQAKSPSTATAAHIGPRKWPSSNHMPSRSSVGAAAESTSPAFPSVTCLPPPQFAADRRRQDSMATRNRFPPTCHWYENNPSPASRRGNPCGSIVPTNCHFSYGKASESQIEVCRFRPDSSRSNTIVLPGGPVYVCIGAFRGRP